MELRKPGLRHMTVSSYFPLASVPVMLVRYRASWGGRSPTNDEITDGLTQAILQPCLQTSARSCMSQIPTQRPWRCTHTLTLLRTPEHLCTLPSSGPRLLSFVFIKPYLLQPLLKLAAEIPLLFKVVRPPFYASLLSVLSLSRNLNHRLPEKLDYAFFERLLARVATLSRGAAPETGFQVSRLRAPAVQRLALHYLI